MALTELGFSRRTYDDILSGKIELAKQLFGEDIDTSELTPLGKFIRINAYDQALIEEEAEQIYYSIFPNTATGTSLDRLCVFVGISRNPATYSQYTVTFKGAEGAVIPANTRVRTESGIELLTLEEHVIGDSGEIDVVVESVEAGGIGNVTAAEINTIVETVADVDSVIGKEVITKGEDVESDYALRERFNSAKEGMGGGNETAIISALLRVESVTHAGIIVNETDGTDESGRPPHSFECFVKCDNSEDTYQKIAETIFTKKPIGIRTYGTQTESILDSAGNSHDISFSLVTSVPVYVRIAITTTAEFEGETGKETIKKNLETYVDNIGMGNTLVYSSLYGQIYNVTGVQEVTELQISKDGVTWGTTNIEAAQYENCVFTQVEIKQNGADGYEVI